MCFSATVSFSAAALLVPAGIYCFSQVSGRSHGYWMIALVPLLFGIQQGFEGRLWQVVAGGDAETVRMLALAFMFFSHFLWLFWIPLASCLVEPDARRKRTFLVVAVLGSLGGAAMYLPLLLHVDWLSVSVRQHSIVYTITTTYEDYLPLGVDRAIYALIVLSPLLDSSHRHFRVFGLLVALSMLGAAVLYDYAFISVWCFCAAALSLYLVRMFREQRLSGAWVTAN